MSKSLRRTRILVGALVWAALVTPSLHPLACELWGDGAMAMHRAETPTLTATPQHDVTAPCHDAAGCGVVHVAPAIDAAPMTAAGPSSRETVASVAARLLDHLAPSIAPPPRA